jgi:hypothetical protein
MNETKNLKLARRMPRILLVWLIFFATFVLLLVAADLMPHTPRNLSPQNLHIYLQQLVIAVVGSSILLGLWLFIRWACNRRNLGRLLVGSAILATLAAIFYLEEDWRGKRAWEQCKAELEAQGVVMDWDKYLPPSVPDDQNFFMASTNILVRFKKAQTDAEIAMATNNTWLRIDYSTMPVFETTKSKPLLVAEITILPTASAGHDLYTNRLVVKFNEPSAPKQVQDLIKKTVGQSVLGSAGFRFYELQLSNISPAQISVQADAPLAFSDIANLVPKDLVTNLGHLRIEANGNINTFQVLLADVHVTTAADYLKWSDQFVPAFDEVREALKRPYAVLPGDYSRPYLRPIPNFVMMRALAQTLAQRAQCDFLLGRSGPALHEIALIQNVCRILEKPPTGKPMTLVEAMINVAISGLYAATVADGFRFHAWRQPQLTALQAQIQTINLPPFVFEAFRDQIVASARDLEITDPSELQQWFSSHGQPARIIFWEKLESSDFWFLTLAPRGWYDQNMAVAANLQQKTLAGFDLPNNLILPGKFEEEQHVVESILHHWSPWNWWAAIAVPNTVKATQTTAYNQTLVNEAQIVCALERYHLANGEYPATLDVLMPQFIEKLPHDIIGGQPLHYHRTDDGKFLLYSVGWNEKDDGGLPGTLADVTKGDWVWR